MDNKDKVILARLFEWQYQLDKYTNLQLVNIANILKESKGQLFKQLEKATITDWSKQRTEQLLGEVQAAYGPIKAKINNDMGAMVAEAGKASYDEHSKILSFDGKASAVVGVPVTSNQMRALVDTTPVGGRTLSRWVDRTFDINMREKIQREVAAGIINGDGYLDIVKRLKASIPGTERELKTLGKTYVQSVNVQAMKDVYNANPEIVKSVLWRATVGLNTCVECASLDGVEYPVNGHPGCPLHPLCVHPDTSVFAPDKIAAFITSYDGPVVELTVSDGRRFTVSVNHMLATPRGLVKAGSITEGDYVIDTPVSKYAVTYPDDNRYPSSIKEQVEAFAESPGVTTIRMPVATEHLHGDTEFGDGYVDIVTFDSLLEGDFESFCHEFFGKDGFVDRSTGHIPFSSKSDLLFSLWRSSLALGCEVGGFGVPPVLFRRTIKHHLSVCLSNASGGDAMIDENFVDHYPFDAELFGDSIFRSPVYVWHDYITRANKCLPACTSDPEQLKDGIFPPPNYCRNFRNGLPASTKFTRIKNVRRFHYTGHLYDLHCFSGLYYISGILSSNCRCVLVPITVAAEKMGLTEKDLNEMARPYTIERDGKLKSGKTGKVIESGTFKGNFESWLKNASEKQQRAFFGPKRYEALKDGSIKFDQLVDKQTGRLKRLDELGLGMKKSPPVK